MDTENEVLQQLGMKTVLDENEDAVQLSSLWQEQRTVMIFVRHFG